ncbi:MAG: hypothetical protein LC670_04500, partial [Flavobacteriales bacterium]|nr:hypothetical protein [Flavobacteriales bacterium]
LGAVYTPSAGEIAAGTVELTLTTTGNGNCLAENDQMTITITPAPVVDAGAGGELCSNNPAITLEGSVTEATGGIWSGGSGSFNPDANTLNAVYTPTAGEISDGVINLTLTSTSNGNCIAVTDQVTYTFGPSPEADAGPDQTLCANNAVAQLEGSVNIASGGTWSGGSGTFSPSANALNATYQPAAFEIISGGVTLTLTTTGNGDCNPVSDQVIITYTPAPTANAGADVSVCANNAQVILAGSVTTASGGTWTGGSGVFFPDANSLGASYTPSEAEIAAGSVTLTLTTTGNGNCVPVSDDMTITITEEPEVNAGIDLNICENNNIFELNGTVENAGGGTWTGGTGTFDPSPDVLNPTYTPSTGDLNAGSITFTLTSTDNGGCNPEADQVVITFTPAPEVNVGDDITVCASSPATGLSAIFSTSAGIQWSGGAGNFSPSDISANPVYTPTAAEIAAGSVTLTATTTGNGNCNAVTDEITINYTPEPAVDAGSNQESCANNPVVSLGGSFSNADAAQWSGGTGFFDPSPNSPTAQYTPSNADILNGGVTLTLTTTGSGACASVSDQMTISIAPAPVVNAGEDVSVCANNSTVNLNGSVSFASGGQWTGGTGVFTPNATSLTATYQPSAAEIATGFVTLTLNTTGNGNCNAESDQVTITFTEAPVADAGTDMTFCANNAEIQLNGSFTVSEGASWVMEIASWRQMR